jgi:two-component system cell cycle response regulator
MALWPREANAHTGLANRRILKEQQMPSQQARLLIVDDDPAAIQLMGRMLAHYPDQRFATTGEAALRLAHESTPDLILLDAHMPGLDGFDVCRALKAQPQFRDVLIAFVSRFSDPRYEARALQLGAADFIAKPCLPADLLARVRLLLAQVDSAVNDPVLPDTPDPA